MSGIFVCLKLIVAMFSCSEGILLSIERVERTSLWKRTLGQRDGEYTKELERLSTSYISFRDKASALVSKISEALPGLTQHDVSHLDALWEIADLICGENYAFNPLEAYVFGGAVLLHDSALCFEAYDNGVNGVRATKIWKDTYASLSTGINVDEATKIADFAALRHLHAHQAERLTEKNWLDPESGAALYLIEDNSLRKHLGKIIGKIAASHHWPIEEVESKLPSQINTLAGFPRPWRIDPVKIACMLRCADAAHIDNERAPDFLHALIKRRGVSFAHWKAQNKLAAVDIDQTDSSGSTLLFTSTHGFLESESDAWWIAYDTVCMIEKEIRSSNALLESKRSEAQFKVKRVRGIESPELMSKHIQTEGWNPCMAEVHVGNIENLVSTLGGEKLYGEGCDKLEVIVRELIQNARDSIQARRQVEDGFLGRILIRLESTVEGYFLYVEDNGVGMSKRVLTGPLLDFGTSFWTSSLVHSEFPGLRSSKFKSSGKYGIGFYSVFMGADKVFISSKPWNGGASDVWQLNFKSGLSLRPLLKNKQPQDFKTDVSTQVKLLLKPDVVKGNGMVEVKRNTVGSENLLVNVGDFIASICTALDVSVFFAMDGSDYNEVHQDILTSNCYESWLKKLSYAEYQSKDVGEYVSFNYNRLRPIAEGDYWHGLAAISVTPSSSQNFLSIKTVDKLSSSVHGRSGEDFVGFVNYLPKSAKREISEFSASQDAIDSWAKEQVEILDDLKIDPIEKCFLAYSLAYFKVDPINVSNVVIVRNEGFGFVTFKELASISVKEEVVFVKTSDMDHVDTYTKINSVPGKVMFKPLRNSSFLSLKFKNGNPENEMSALGCLCREIVKLGLKPSFRIEKSIGDSAFGRCDGLIVTAVD